MMLSPTATLSKAFLRNSKRHGTRAISTYAADPIHRKTSFDHILKDPASTMTYSTSSSENIAVAASSAIRTVSSSPQKSFSTVTCFKQILEDPALLMTYNTSPNYCENTKESAPLPTATLTRTTVVATATPELAPALGGVSLSRTSAAAPLLSQ